MISGSALLLLIAVLPLGSYGNPAVVEPVSRSKHEEQGDNFTLSIVHLNDFHARFDPVSPEFTSCDPSLVNTCVPYPCPKGREDTCVGGIARVSTAMRTIKKRWPQSVFLNGGDNFQGSLYYHVHRHAIMSFFINRLPYDAISLGNHEFDQGMDNIKAFIQRLSVPVVAANIDSSNDTQFAALIRPSIVVERGNRKIGIIGYLLNNTAEISQTGALRFRNEWEAVNEEAARLKQQGVDIILCVSHDGLAGDIEVAKRAPDVDVIVGGHSHTFMYSGPPPSDDLVRSEYPMVVITQDSGRKVLVVQAFAATKYLGHVLVDFDKNGEVVGWEGKPIFLDNSVREDERILMLLRPWRFAVRAIGGRIVGRLDHRLSQDNFTCITGECSIGDVVADAFVDHTTREGSKNPATVGAVIGWSMVANLERGDVTFENVFSVLAYEYTVDTFDILGRDLLSAMETAAAGDGLFQWSGIVMSLDFNKPAGERVWNVSARTDLSQTPAQYPPLDLNRVYKAVAQSVSLSGGYSNPVLARTHFNRVIGKYGKIPCGDLMVASMPQASACMVLITQEADQVAMVYQCPAVIGPMDFKVLETYLGDHYNLVLENEGRVFASGLPHPRRYSGLPTTDNNLLNNELLR